MNKGLSDIEAWILIWGEDMVQYVEHYKKQAERSLYE